MRRIAITVAITGVVSGLMVLGLTTDFLVDWAWFSAIGYLPVYWTILGAQTLLFLATFVGSATLLCVNGFIAYRFAQPRRRIARVDGAGASTRIQTLPELWELTSRRLPWPLIIGASAIILGLLVAGGEVSGGR
jgi:uncharacterized membrane protein (UPF0182 family)